MNKLVYSWRYGGVDVLSPKEPTFLEIEVSGEGFKLSFGNNYVTICDKSLNIDAFELLSELSAIDYPAEKTDFAATCPDGDLWEVKVDDITYSGDGAVRPPFVRTLERTFDVDNLFAYAQDKLSKYLS